MKTRLHKLLVGLALLAGIMAPTAIAQTPNSVTVPSGLAYIQGPGGNNDLSRWENFRGGPGGGGPLLASDYLGHNVGGPTGVGIVAGMEPVTVGSESSFDWIDAAVGAGFAAGIALLAAGLVLLRRRRPLAHA